MCYMRLFGRSIAYVCAEFAIRVECVMLDLNLYETLHRLMMPLLQTLRLWSVSMSSNYTRHYDVHIYITLQRQSFHGSESYSHFKSYSQDMLWIVINPCCQLNELVFPKVLRNPYSFASKVKWMRMRNELCIYQQRHSCYRVTRRNQTTRITPLFANIHSITWRSIAEFWQTFTHSGDSRSDATRCFKSEARLPLLWFRINPGILRCIYSDWWQFQSHRITNKHVHTFSIEYVVALRFYCMWIYSCVFSHRNLHMHISSNGYNNSIELKTLTSHIFRCYFVCSNLFT